ncbi:MAG: GNAT family N-acetyltransferase [Brevinematia bacterium]
MDIYITEIRPEDYEKVVEISKDIFQYSSFRVDSRVVDILGSENVHKVSLGILENSTNTFIAVSMGRILGFLSWTFDRNLTRLTARKYYRIRLLGVDKSFQRRGIGSELLKYFIGFVAKQKGDIIEVSTDVDNLPAIGIYLKHRFFYTSSFSTFRFFPRDVEEKEDFLVVKLTSRELEDFERLRSRNIDFRNYPLQCLFDLRIEDRLKLGILHNYHKTIELNLNSFGVYLAYHGNLAIGYGILREDFVLSSLLSRISGKHICVYRVFDLFVLEEFRANGVGSCILRKMIKDIPKPYDFIEAVIPSHNYRMANTLTSVGFRLSHTMVNLAY